MIPALLGKEDSLPLLEVAIGWAMYYNKNQT